MTARHYIFLIYRDNSNFMAELLYLIKYPLGIRKQLFLLAGIIIFSVCSMDLYAADDAGSRASFTRGGWAGARYVAMGKAAEVIVNDVYSIYWNPAGLRELKETNNLTEEEIKKKASTGDVDSITEDDLTRFSEEEYSTFYFQAGISSAIIDIEREAGFAGIAFNVPVGIAGIGLYSIQSRDIESWDDQGNYIKDLDYSAYAGYLSYGWGSGVASIGISLKGLYEKIGNYNYYGGGADLGTQIELVPLVKVGFVIQDIGSGLKPVDKYENIEDRYDFASPSLKLSASITNRTSDFIVAITGIKKLEQEKYEVNVGCQYNVIRQVSIYLGLNEALFTSGISAKLYEIDVAYAFSLDKIDLGYNNIISISIAI